MQDLLHVQEAAILVPQVGVANTTKLIANPTAVHGPSEKAVVAKE